MTKVDDFLVEILTEELPPRSLLKLGEAFSQQIQEGLRKANLSFKSAQFFITPRRLAVLVRELDAKQKNQVIERKGPAVSAAFDKNGKPTQACLGFAKSCGVTPEQLVTIKNNQGEWVGLQQEVIGELVTELLPGIVEQALTALPIPKRMRWSDSDAQFVRPVHAVIMLYGDKVVPATILKCEAGRVTRGHRFLAPDWITIPRADAYESLLEVQGLVIADFAKRKEKIRNEATAIVKKNLDNKGHLFISSEEFLDEVTGLVEWPVALFGNFDKDFLNLPAEVLIASMQDHQRYFPVRDQQEKLLPHFVTISNIESQDVKRVIHGNERVLRARLSDAAFFYNEDKKESLEARLPRLKEMIFQAKLGTLYDKAERLSKLMTFVASKLQIDKSLASRAGLLGKTDLTTNMVGEFPEVQGIMGGYYALHDKEPENVVIAIKEQYFPRFAKDSLPTITLSQALAIADRIDMLVGAFAIKQIPTGDKDPYGLRRAALGILRILIEKRINLDLKELLEFSFSTFTIKIENTDTVPQLLEFMQERLRAWYQEAGVTPDVFAAVFALGVTNPLDADQRIKAVQNFKKLSAAEKLSIANKRVSNILSKYEEKIQATKINPSFFENAAEQQLAQQIEAKSQAITDLSHAGKYEEVLLQLAELRQPVDDFFEQVMVMTEDKSRRENRILLLSKLRALFLQVADIALLQ